MPDGCEETVANLQVFVVIYNVILSGGITDEIAGRLALRYDAMDGWWDNKLLREEGPHSDNWYARAGLLFDASDNIEVVVKYEYGDFQTDDRSLVAYPSDQPQNFLGEDVIPIVADEDQVAFDLGDDTELRTDVAAVTVNWELDISRLRSRSVAIQARYRLVKCAAREGGGVKRALSRGSQNEAPGD